MRNQIPRVNGRGLNAISVSRQLNPLIDAANRFNNLAVGEGLELTMNDTGAEIRLARRRKLRSVQSIPSSIRIVAVVEKPSDSDDFLLVREVQYKDGARGPIADEDRPYEFKDEEFEALPWLGRQAKEYQGKEVNAVPKPGDTFFEAFTFGEVVIVGDFAEAGTGIGVAKVVSVGDDTIDCTFGGDPITVAKPFLLRRTPFDAKTVGGVAYTYLTGLIREEKDVASGLITRAEVVPRFLAGDEISVCKGPENGTGVADVDWLMLPDSRAWCRVTNRL